MFALKSPSIWHIFVWYAMADFSADLFIWCLTDAAIRTSRSCSLVARSPLICSKSSVDIALSPATKSEELAASAPGCSPFIPLFPLDKKPRPFNIALLCLSVHLRTALLTLLCRVEVGGGKFDYTAPHLSRPHTRFLRLY